MVAFLKPSQNAVVRKRTEAAPPTGELILGQTEVRPAVGIILVKFNFRFKHRHRIPAGIPEVARIPDYEMDMKHQIEESRAGRGDKAWFGRWREGRVDSGENVFTTRRPTQAAVVRRGITNNGFRLVGLHWFHRRKESADEERTNPADWVVCAAYAQVEKSIEVTSSVTSSLRALAGFTWSQCYVWDNPNSVATLNFVGILPDQRPLVALAVRDKKIVPVDVTPTGMTEAEE